MLYIFSCQQIPKKTQNNSELIREHILVASTAYTLDYSFCAIDLHFCPTTQTN